MSFDDNFDEYDGIITELWDVVRPLRLKKTFRLPRGNIASKRIRRIKREIVRFFFFGLFKDVNVFGVFNHLDIPVDKSRIINHDGFRTSNDFIYLYVTYILRYIFLHILPKIIAQT